ncbi:MAG: AraC family transcriptional regulator [Robiginitomaculum sp.]|nr:MAG: AraC family transcriptional regulator [Robiginitomaculum sp.]
MTPGPSSSLIATHHCPPQAHRLEAFFTGNAYAPHRHDTYAIGITMQGVQSFDYRGQTRNALPGNIVVLHPDELHDGRAGTKDGFRYRTLYIEPSHIQSVLGGRALPFIEGGVSLDPRLYAAVLPLLENLDRPLDTLEYQDAIYDLAVVMDQITSDKKPLKRHACQSAELARQFIYEHMDEEITLDLLEKVTDCDRWELSRHFRAMFGTSPYRHLTMRRLDKARIMMAAGNSIAQTAVACTFSDQSHFTRHFKKAYGLTPRQWTANFA